METATQTSTCHASTWIVRRDESRFSVVELDDNKVDTYLDELRQSMPQCSWKLEPRFPVSGAD